MSANFRIFVSSTMEDLANEREMVEQKIRSFNFECVRAETMTPTGVGSWQRIQDAIDSCHLVILILGERYGWVPKSGPLAAGKLSVTHGEFRYARERDLRVLAYFKKLGVKSARRTRDAVARDKFRDEVEGWRDGVFRSEFQLAADLAQRAGESITAFLSDQYLRGLALNRHTRQAPRPAPPAEADIVLPRELCEAVRERRTVLFAGSGISLAAGMPSSAFFAETLRNASREHDPDYEPSTVGMGIASIAGDFERYAGRRALGEKIRLLLEAPGVPTPTAAHTGAVQLFPRVITTNYDTLFEQAAAALGTGHAVAVAPDVAIPLAEPFLLKLHGSLAAPESVVITEDDVDRFEFSHAKLLPEVERLLDEYMPVVAGSSLRDPTIYRLFRNRRWAGGKQTYGYAIVPGTNACLDGRHALLGLQTIAAPVESVFATLLASDPAASTRTAALP